MKYFAALRILAVIAIPVAAFVAIVFGGPKSLPPMASVNDPFKTVDFSDLPPLRHYAAEDGAALAYRYYDPVGATPRGSVVLIHGSSASSNSMHILAKGFANAGYAAYALDIRGHGASGIKGKIKVHRTTGRRSRLIRAHGVASKTSDARWFLDGWRLCSPFRRQHATK